MASQSSFEVRDDRGQQRARLGVDGAGRPALELRNENQSCSIVLGPSGIELLGSDSTPLIGGNVTRGDLAAMVREAVAAELAVSIAKVEEIARRCSEDAKAAVAEIVTLANAEASTAGLQLAEAAEQRHAAFAAHVTDVEARLAKTAADQVATAKTELVETIRRGVRDAGAESRTNRGTGGAVMESGAAANPTPWVVFFRGEA